MMCIVCHGDDIRLQDVKEEFQVGSDVVYVPVRLSICQTCGERYYDRRTVRFLEQTESRLKQGAAEVREVGRVLILE
jgi:YgiT-type zinc finger domain-containing protein